MPSSNLRGYYLVPRGKIPTQIIIKILNKNKIRNALKIASLKSRIKK